MKPKQQKHPRLDFLFVFNLCQKFFKILSENEIMINEMLINIRLWNGLLGPIK